MVHLLPFLDVQFRLIMWIKSEMNLWLLVQLIGDGTRRMAEYRQGIPMKCVYFRNVLQFQIRIGRKEFTTGCGGVETAPMLFWVLFKIQRLSSNFLLEKNKNDVLQLDDFAKIGDFCITTKMRL